MYFSGSQGTSNQKLQQWALWRISSHDYVANLPNSAHFWLPTDSISSLSVIFGILKRIRIILIICNHKCTNSCDLIRYLGGKIFLGRCVINVWDSVKQATWASGNHRLISPSLSVKGHQWTVTNWTVSIIHLFSVSLNNLHFHGK